MIIFPLSEGHRPERLGDHKPYTSNLVIFATKKGRYEEAKIDHGSGTLAAFCIATTHGGGGAATGDDLQYTL